MNGQIPKEVLESESVRQFLKGFHTDATRETYWKKLLQFSDFCKMTPDGMLAEATGGPKSFQRRLVDYIEGRKREVSGSTISLTVAALKHFFDMNDAEQAVNWSKVSRLVPKSRKVGSDRAPTVDEIRQMLQVADVRTRCVILVCASSGIRVGAFEGLRWGDLAPVYEEGDGERRVRAAKLVVYRGLVEEYVTFVTPECYGALMQYRRMREGIGEAVTARSPLIRDAWDNNKYRKRFAEDPKVARPLTPKAIANMMGRFLRTVHFRDPDGLLPAGGGRGNHYEFKQVHGFRKFFKTNAERTIKTIDVEKLIGHAENYYRPSEEYLLEQYAKVVPNLTISEAAELRDRVQRQAAVSDRKVGEIERENVALQDRLGKLESSYNSLKEILEDILLEKTRGRK